MDFSAQPEWSGTLSVRLLPDAVAGDYEVKKVIIPRVDAKSIPLSTASNFKCDSNYYSGKIISWKNISDECTHVTFDVVLSNLNSSERIYLHSNRKPAEKVTDALHRLGLSLAKKLSKKMNKKRDSKRKPPTIAYSVVSGEGEKNLMNSHAKVWEWQSPPQQQVRFTVDSVNIMLKVECCPPTIVSVKTFENFGQYLFVSVPLIVLVDTIFSFKTTVDWYVDDQRVQLDSAAYTPIADDIGKEVMVVVSAFDQDGTRHGIDAYRFLHKVQQRPNNAVLDFRHDFTKPRSTEQEKKSIRVLSYNILNANESDYPHCDSKFIVKERRIPLVVFEVIQYQADILCLQEVDESTYNNLLNPILAHYGYQGVFKVKEGSKEGGAIFWSLRVFCCDTMTDYKSHLIRDLFDRSRCRKHWGSMKDILNLFEKHERLNKLMCQRLGHMLQTVELTHIGSGKRILLANTHLFFHPKASHVRLMQLYACLYQIDIERSDTSAIVLCGDLNSSPLSGAARLLWHRTVRPPDGETDQGTTWKYLCTFSIDSHEDNLDAVCNNIEAPTIRLPDKALFPSLVSAYQVLPDCTHFIHNFAATLDYIMVSENEFEPLAWAEVPPIEILSKDSGMPSEVLPSDHVSLVCDLAFRTKLKET